MKSLKLASTLLVSGLLLLLVVGGCKKKDTTDNTNNNTNNTSEQYIIVEGKKFVMKTPKTFRVFIMGGDTSLDWWGNHPYGDTGLTISHPVARKSGNFTVSDFTISADEVTITLRIGRVLGDPYIAMDGGEYKLERVDGKWVSTCKNGTGYDVNTTSRKFTGIEFRVVWPD